MWIDRDPVGWAKWEEMSWDAERASAERRRLLSRNRPRVGRRPLARWARYTLEHASLILLRFARRSEPKVEPESMSDAEVARLLALLSLAVDVVPVESTSTRVTAAEEEVCASGC